MQSQPAWLIALHGAILALPIVLAFLHVALFAYDRGARENLFYAGAMLSFAMILFHDYGPGFLSPFEPGGFLERATYAGTVLASLFSVLTYYAIRTAPVPRSGIAIVVAGCAFAVAIVGLPRNIVGHAWPLYALLVVVDVVRVEVMGKNLRRDPAGFPRVAFSILGVSIGLQLLAHFDVIDSLGGVVPFYVIGMIAAAIGMSLHFARRLALSRTVEAENERKTLELAQARELQLSMLPRRLPDVHGLDVAASTHPAAEVGGDYYDLRSAGGDRILVAFGDATGHGLAAGIVVTAAKAMFQSLSTEASPRQLLADSNRVIGAMQFRTLRLCLALAYVSPREATFAIAGMPPLLIHRAAGNRVEELGRGGLPLGSRMVPRYEEHQTMLAPGDTLLFASDGFAELLDPEGQLLGYERVAAAFAEASQAPSAREVNERLVQKASAFRGLRPQEDDMTFLVVRVVS